MKKQPNLFILSALLLAFVSASTASAQEFKLRKLSDEERERLFGDGGEPRADEAFPAPRGLKEIPEQAIAGKGGVFYVVMDPGFGEEKAGPNDLVTIEYTGWLQDGRVFDSTELAREPRSVQVNQAAQGLSDLFGEMVEGEFRRVWVPEEIADNYRKPELEGHVLFDIRLISIERAPLPPAELVAPPEDAVTTSSGMSYKVLKQGRGEHRPTMDSLVLAHVSAWTPEGVMTLSTRRGDGGPQSFEVDEMVEGFQESLMTMSVGEKRLIWMPRHLASMKDVPVEYLVPQVVELELVSFLDGPKDLAEDLRMPPSSARKTESGLAYEVVREGVGETHPGPSDLVVVHYAVWSADGSFIDSSFKQGKPHAIELSEKMPAGWNEALQMMVEGQRMRVWVPEELGFLASRSLPAGPLVFDIDLVALP